MVITFPQAALTVGTWLLRWNTVGKWWVNGGMKDGEKLFARCEHGNLARKMINALLA